MTCILCAVLSDHWVQTTEPISSPFKEEMRAMNIDFDVGLWRVCPSVQWTPENADISRDKPEVYCSDVGYKRLWNTVDWKELGLWGPVESTTTVISRMRLSAVFILLSAVIIVISTLSVLLGHCFKGKKMLIASGLYAFGGLILGSGLFTFVCFLTDEFGVRNSSGVPRSSSSNIGSDENGHSSVHYKYGKSFIEAVFAFLAAEIAAVLCIHAFLNRFESEEEFIKMIPGMERRIREHSSTYFANNSDTANVTISGSDHGEQGPKNGYLSQPSFVHRPPNSKASEESLYGLQMPDPVAPNNEATFLHHHQSSQPTQQTAYHNQQLPQLSESVILSDISVCPPPPPSRTLSSSVLGNTVVESDGSDVSPPRKREKEEDRSRSPVPPRRSVGNSKTLPRMDLYTQIPPKTAQIKKVGSSRPSLLSPYSSKEEGDGAEDSPRMSESALAMATMPRHHHHHHGPGSGKKKSVTIGTFTKVEAFDFTPPPI